MRFENKFDEAIEDVSVVHGTAWNDDSKIQLFARFCLEAGVSFEAWEKFLEREADEEILGDDVDDDDGDDIAFIDDESES